ncbi:MAG: Nif3-like dinuclear metal center hexameric protein [Bacillota bacterium]
MISVSEIIGKLNKFAPANLAEAWDNVGLQVGDPDVPVNKIGISLDVTENIIREAVNSNIDLLISHHPLIFKGISNVNSYNPTGKIIRQAIKANLNIYSGHTNIDQAQGGLNDFLAEKLEINDIKYLSENIPHKKIVIYVPEDNLQEVRNALHSVGAGEYNNYDRVAYYSKGTGTFRPLAGSKPAIGMNGQQEYVSEYRLEVMYPEHKEDAVMKALKSAHPYEEPVFDIYQPDQLKGEYLPARIGYLKEQMPLEKYIYLINKNLDLDHCRVAGKVDKKVKKVAVACGSGSNFIKNAVKAGADVLVTGDVKYHEVQKALSSDLAVVDAGHYGTEKIFPELIQNYLLKQNYSSGDIPEVEVFIDDQFSWKIYQ